MNAPVHSFFKLGVNFLNHLAQLLFAAPVAGSQIKQVNRECVSIDVAPEPSSSIRFLK